MSDPLNILWLKSGPLHPLDSGGKIRTYQMLRELNRHHPVTYLALCPPGTPHTVKESAGEYSRAQHWVPWNEAQKGTPSFYADLAVNLVGSAMPYALAKYASAAFRAQLDQLDQSGQFDLILCDFLVPAINLYPRTQPLRTPTVLFQHNVEALIWQRMQDNARGLPRWYLRLQWERMRRAEAWLCARFDGVIGVSDEDCDLMRRDYELSNVLGSVPTGVDVDYFQPATGPKRPRSIAFLGSMDWQPNIDAVLWFHAEIWPLIKKAQPDATLTIIGRRPTEAVKKLAAADASIQVTGSVDDVRPHLGQIEAMVVPLRVGGGTRIKIYEAMAMGLPVVSTRIGAEGLSVQDEENILLADEPASIARGLVRLLQDTALRDRLGSNARTLVCERFSWPSVTSVFEQHCREARSRHKKNHL